MRTSALTSSLAAMAVMVAGACDEPEPAVLVEDPVLEEERAEARMPEVEQVPEARVAPAVAVMSRDVDCPTTAVFFEVDAAELGPEDERKLVHVADCLRGTAEAEQVQITGRTDPRGSEEYNRELARERADAVASYLRQLGATESSFEIRAMGEQGVVEDMPVLWPAQRHAMVRPTDPVEMERR